MNQQGPKHKSDWINNEWKMGRILGSYPIISTSKTLTVLTRVLTVCNTQSGTPLKDSQVQHNIPGQMFQQPGSVESGFFEKFSAVISRKAGQNFPGRRRCIPHPLADPNWLPESRPWETPATRSDISRSLGAREHRKSPGLATSTNP